MWVLDRRRHVWWLYVSISVNESLLDCSKPALDYALFSPPPNWINAFLVKFKLRAVLVMSCNSLDMLKFKTKTEQLTIKCKKICQYDNKKCNVEVSKAM